MPRDEPLVTSRTSRPLRIVAGIRQFVPAVGGAQTLLIDILAALRARGHHTSVVTFDGASIPDLRGRGSGLPPAEWIDGVTVHRVAPDGGPVGRLLTALARHPMGGRLVRHVAGIDVPYWGERPSIVGMSATLMRIPADVFISVGWFSRHVPLMHLTAALRRLPVVGVPCFHLAQRSAYWPRHRRLVRSAAAVVCLTEPESTHARALGARVVRCIPPSLPAGFADHADGVAWRGHHGIAPDVPIVAFVGRQVEKKGAVHLLRSMRQVWHTHPHVRLLLAGRLRNRDDAMRAAIAALSVTERARILEIDDFTDDDLPSLMAASTMLAVPSPDESFGIVYIEAWACARPIIAASIPSSQWLAADGENALLVTPGDDEALAIAIRRLLDDPVLATALGRRGQSLVAERFRTSAFAAQWIDVVEQTVRGAS